MANSEIDILWERLTNQLIPISQEIVTIQVVTLECGACRHRYEVELLNGDEKMVACPECDNASLQMLVGTE